MNKPLEVDAFGIEIESLSVALDIGHEMIHKRLEAALEVVGAVIKNLSLDDKKRFEEYQEQSDPCR